MTDRHENKVPEPRGKHQTPNSMVGDGIEAGNTRWTFSKGVAKTFTKHVRKSVPLYEEGHELIARVSDYFIKDGSVVYELGVSTGQLISRLALRHKDKQDARFIGIDVEPSMIEQAAEEVGELQGVSLEVGDINLYDYEPADFIVAYYTVQFVAPRIRQALIQRLYDALNWGGGLVLFEKVRGPDARFQDICTGIYTDFKLEQGYSPDEIVGKTRSLTGVLEPFSTQGNLDLLQRAGFVDMMTIMKHIPFEGFLAIK